MEIIALGGCCRNSQQNYENAKIAAKNCGLPIEVKHITEIEKIMAYGIMSTPALVINNKVVSVGRMLSVSQIENLIKLRI